MDLDTTRPFPRWQGLRAGISRATLDGPSYQRVLHGVLVESGVPLTPRLRAQAALVCFFAHAFASHATAARVWEAPIATLPGEHVTVPTAGERLRREGVTCHVRGGAVPVVHDGVRVSSLPDLFLELAEQVPLVELVVLGDWMVRRKGVRPEQLVRAARSAPGAAGRLARQAASYVRTGVDSPMETRLRMLLVLAGLPEPRVNLTIRDVDGGPVRRFDLSWPEGKVIVEYDGRHHVEREDQWAADLVRREEIDDHGWRILVVVASGIYRDPGSTVERVWRLLRARRVPGVPARPEQAWRAHFPGHASYL
ncbi:endonuclease domain-containing protein [Nocardioides sp. Soil805]|uniref:endonuclease domain-containing protein n=1 Tax=Nocardioides sp. Soil805 TaxID=1736416 RepID=UPI0007026C2A|nr:DUF559 domain-containing protein [Nocardioides sp. Soil805]KRF37193.1 hypothetical protein ASG94_07545 [Nocardioides sp. Soil805]